MEAIAAEQINAFLTELGARHRLPATLVWLGGSALCLLGSGRPTLDIDYVGDDLYENELQRAIAKHLPISSSFAARAPLALVGVLPLLRNFSLTCNKFSRITRFHDPQDVING